MILPASESVTVALATMAASKIDVETDSSPRKFLVDLRNTKAGCKPMVDIHYFACSDMDGWCLGMKQRYVIGLDRNRDVGGVMGRRFMPGGGREGMRDLSSLKR